MELSIAYLDGVRFEVRARGHEIVCDQTTEDGGQNAGMSPPELLLASLGSCVAFYALQYLKARNLAQTGLEVAITAEKMQRPGRLANFRLNVKCPIDLTAEQSEALMRSVRHCTIHNTLQSAPDIQIEISAPAIASS